MYMSLDVAARVGAVYRYRRKPAIDYFLCHLLCDTLVPYGLDRGGLRAKRFKSLHHDADATSMSKRGASKGPRKVVLEGPKNHAPFV